MTAVILLKSTVSRQTPANIISAENRLLRPGFFFVSAQDRKGTITTFVPVRNAQFPDDVMRIP